MSHTDRIQKPCFLGGGGGNLHHIKLKHNWHQEFTNIFPHLSE